MSSGVCVCVCVYRCPHTDTHAHTARALRKVLGGSGEGRQGWGLSPPLTLPCPARAHHHLPPLEGGRRGKHNTAVENCWLLGKLLSTPTLAVTVTAPPWTTSGWGGGKQEGGMKEDHKNTSGHQQSKLYLFPHPHPPTHCRPALNLMPWEVFPWQRRAWVWSSYDEAPEPSPT